MFQQPGAGVDPGLARRVAHGDEMPSVSDNGWEIAFFDHAEAGYLLMLGTWRLGIWTA